MLFYTADEHYYHKNIIKYSTRPFANIDEMVEELIRRHNEVVKDGDVVVHVGDFSFASRKTTREIINKLNGTHVFLKGDHDSVIKRIYKNLEYLEIRKYRGQFIVACHWAMRVWPMSHYGSWQVCGHSHGKLKPQGLQYDVGVDNNDFYPVSFEKLKSIMEGLQDAT